MTSSFLRGGCAALALIAATPALAQAPSWPIWCARKRQRLPC